MRRGRDKPPARLSVGAVDGRDIVFSVCGMYIKAFIRILLRIGMARPKILSPGRRGAGPFGLN